MAEPKVTARDAKSDTADVQKQMDKITEQGYVGYDNDPTPNEHYTVAGVVAGKPTPETDPEHAREVRIANEQHRGI